MSVSLLENPIILKKLKRLEEGRKRMFLKYNMLDEMRWEHEEGA